MAVRLSEEEILGMFRETGALQEGHFLLSSGLHSDRYFQCALVLQYPDYTEKLCQALADKFREERLELVVGPAMGGIIVAYELARRLGVRSLFAEREEGRMTLRRGFQVSSGGRALVAEDVVTTGGSVQEVIDLLRKERAEVVGVAALIDRSGGQTDFGVRFDPLIEIKVSQFPEDQCPFCARGQPITKPGSRKIR